jgi:hypothetical protein
MTERFDAFCRRREQAALAATIPGYTTRKDTLPENARRLENDWSRALFDGPFYRSAAPAADGTPITSLVFVQSHDGNTGAVDPSTLGGGDTDLHLIYEGLSRVDADAVMAGATTARARDVVFSVWHPQLTSLRLARSWSSAASGAGGGDRARRVALRRRPDVQRAGAQGVCYRPHRYRANRSHPRRRQIVD